MNLFFGPLFCIYLLFLTCLASQAPRLIPGTSLVLHETVTDTSSITLGPSMGGDCTLIPHPVTGHAMAIHHPLPDDPRQALLATEGSGQKAVTRSVPGVVGSASSCFPSFDNSPSFVCYAPASGRETRWALASASLVYSAPATAYGWLTEKVDAKYAWSVPFGVFYTANGGRELILMLHADPRARAVRSWHAAAAASDSEWVVHSVFGGNSTHVALSQTWRRPNAPEERARRRLYVFPLNSLMSGALSHWRALPPPHVRPLRTATSDWSAGDRPTALLLSPHAAVLTYPTSAEVVQLCCRHPTGAPLPAPALIQGAALPSFLHASVDSRLTQRLHALADGSLVVTSTVDGGRLHTLSVSVPDYDAEGRLITSLYTPPTGVVGAALACAVLVVMGLCAVICAVISVMVLSKATTDVPDSANFEACPPSADDPSSTDFALSEPPSSTSDVLG